MSLIRDLVIKKPLSLLSLIKIERDQLNLKPLSKVTIKFDPFGNKTSDIRLFAFLLHAQGTVQTNPKCIIKTEILTDRSNPEVIFNLTNGSNFIFKCTNLQCLEIFQLMNKYITPLAPKESDDSVKMPKIK